MIDPSAQAFLLKHQGDDGGWGYAPGQAATVEGTAAAALALAGIADANAAYRRAVAWLIAAQHADGGWGLTRADHESGWQTAWAVLALGRGAETTAQAAARGADWLLRVPLARNEKTEDVRWVQAVAQIDPTLRGWPWLPDQASWVEPTALTLLALWPFSAARGISARLAEAVRYLQDRRCQGGGWNVGNPVMFSNPLPMRACPTAWVLLALARVAPEAIRPDDLAALRGEMRADGSASALGWGLLALRTLGQDDPAAAARLLARQGADGGWDANPYHTAVAVLALREQM